MRTRTVSLNDGGFSITELLVVILCCVVVGILMISFVRSPRQISSRLTCSVNLRQIGFASQMFGKNHAGYPWTVSTNSGGTFEFTTKGDQTFRHLQVLSNDIYMTIGVVCPQDARVPASNWASIVNSNVSYFIGTDSNPSLPNSIVSGDRNIAKISGVVLTSILSDPPKWIEGSGLHGIKGNIVFGDGHVEQVSSAGLSNALLRVGIATNHFSIP